MADLVRNLRSKREQIEEILRAQNRREGEMKALMDGLKRDAGVSSIEEAKVRLKELSEELDTNEDSMRELDKEMDGILEAAQNAKRGQGT